MREITCSRDSLHNILSFSKKAANGLKTRSRVKPRALNMLNISPKPMMVSCICIVEPPPAAVPVHFVITPAANMKSWVVKQ